MKDGKNKHTSDELFKNIKNFRKEVYLSPLFRKSWLHFLDSMVLARNKNSATLSSASSCPLCLVFLFIVSIKFFQILVSSDKKVLARQSLGGKIFTITYYDQFHVFESYDEFWDQLVDAEILIDIDQNDVWFPNMALNVSIIDIKKLNSW